MKNKNKKYPKFQRLKCPITKIFKNKREQIKIKELESDIFKVLYDGDEITTY